MHKIYFWTAKQFKLSGAYVQPYDKLKNLYEVSLQIPEVFFSITSSGIHVASP